MVELRPAGTTQGDDGGRETGGTPRPGVGGRWPASRPQGREVAGQPPAGAGVRPADLMNHFLSVSERLILAALAKKPGAKAGDVLFACRIEKSKFWTLWSNLQHRGLVDDADGPDGGFVIAAPWVVDLLGDEPLDPKRV